ncbi:MAG: hypothetical protein JO103_06695 [Candidatus Eremiobacteraeota bacterium]|nr:hypothetical protein [Candidatus Eremiobacteraeota bacterium]MBV9409859.1 hypothetical protein [Candidatus Eremiobacteraeota bacterium]
MSIRLAAGAVAAAALLCACSGGSGGGSQPAASAAPAATAPSGPPNALVPSAGKAGAIPLDPDQRRALDAAVAKAKPDLRPRLRYALALGDDGQRHLVVYDGEGLGVDGRHPGKKFEYVVFEVLNAAHGEHYDPQQNSLVAPIPPPKERESSAL